MRLYPCPQSTEGVSLSTVNSVDVRVYPFPQSTVWTWGCIPFHSQQCGREGVPLFTANNVDVRLYPFPPHAVWMCRLYPSPPPTVYCRRGGCILLHLHKMLLKAGMPDCTASGQSGTGMTKNTDAGSCTGIRESTPDRTGVLRYRTETLDAGIPMSAALDSMPMHAQLWLDVWDDCNENNKRLQQQEDCSETLPPPPQMRIPQYIPPPPSLWDAGRLVWVSSGGSGQKPVFPPPPQWLHQSVCGAGRSDTVPEPPENCRYSLCSGGGFFPVNSLQNTCQTSENSCSA